MSIPSTSLRFVIVFFILSLVWNLFAAKSPGAHIFGIIKLGELGIFGWLVSRHFTKQDIPLFVRTLAISGIVSSILAVWQFVNQSSVGGLWYFIGERSFNLSTIGISTVNFGQQILRSYGAFPHPNLLAFFLLVTVMFGLMRISYEKTLFWKLLISTSVLFCSVGIFLTFSRVAILLLVSFFFYAIYTKGKRNKRVIWAGITGIILVSIFLLPSGFLLRGIDFREELFQQSLLIFQSAPYFGIGLNNFFVHQAPLIKNISPIIYQPPHNIFVLSLLSLGTLGWWMVPFGFISAVRAVWEKAKQFKGELRDFYRSILFLLISVVVAGMFDHFFLTLEQGQIMLALILGLGFARLAGEAGKI